MSWPKVKLKDCCKVVGGATPKRNVPEYWESDDIPWVTPKDVSNLTDKTLLDAPEYISQLGFDKCATYLLPKGSILLTSRAPIGNVAIAGKDMCTNQGFKSLVAGEGVDSTYLYYCMLAHSKHLDALGNGATFKEVSKKVVEEFEIPLPPFEEQKRIATILDKADAIRRKRQQAIDLADDFLRSVFLDMFGDPVTNPKGWEVRSCSEVSRQITVGLVIKPASYYVEFGVPAIRSLNIKESGINENNFVFFSEVDNENTLAKSRVFEGDIVIVRSGQPGRAAVIPKHLNGINAIDVLILRTNVDYFEPHYLAYFLNSSAGKQIVMAEERGQIQKHLNVGSLNNAEIPVPPLHLQKKFVKILKGTREKFAKEISGNYSSLFHSLSQKAFAGEL